MTPSSLLDQFFGPWLNFQTSPPFARSYFGKKNLLGNARSLYLSCHSELPRVIRWKEYLEKNPDLRPQTLDKHILSGVGLMEIILPKIAKYGDYDSDLSVAGFWLHDLPEAILKRDISAVQKKDRDDLLEYQAFAIRFKDLADDVYDECEEAYLLQFARRCPDCFPARAKEKMQKLCRKSALSAAFFPAFEVWEYQFYGYEAFKKTGDPVILTHILRYCEEHYRYYAKYLPGFREIFFPREHEKWVVRFIKKNKNVPDQAEYFGWKNSKMTVAKI